MRGRGPDNPRGDGVAPTAEGHDGDEAIDRWLAPLNADPPPVDRGARVGPSSVGPPPRSRRPRLFVAPVAAAAVAVLAGALKDGHRRASLLTGGAGCIAGTNARSCATYHDGILIAAGERFAVGQVGDVPAVGRWNCRDATLALLRPPTGEVWVFERWPVDDEGVAAKPAGRVPNAIRLIVRASDHCDTLLAVRPDGTTPVLTGLRP